MKDDVLRAGSAAEARPPTCGLGAAFNHGWRAVKSACA